MKGFDKWFETFLEEKNIPYVEWEIEGPEGLPHYITNEVVINSIKMSDSRTKRIVKDTLVKIDFVNGDVNHYFHHLATGMVESN